MTDKTWKARERQVAEYFGCKRNPLSGGNSKHSRSDTLHDELFIEHKHRKSHALIRTWDEAKKLAKKEEKTPVVTVSEHGRNGFWVLVHSCDLYDVCDALLYKIYNDR